MLRRNKHKCAALQELWNFAGETAFVFRTLERCSPSDLLEVEDRWIKGVPNLNTIKSARHAAYPMPAETKQRLSEAATRRWARPEYREKREPFLARRDEGRFMLKETSR